MAITVQRTAKEAHLPDTIIDWRGYGSGQSSQYVFHAYGCPHYNEHTVAASHTISEDCVRTGQSACHPMGPIFYAYEYVGCVLSEREANYYDDSDFYASVWDELRGCVREIQWGTTRAGGVQGCSVDATPEIRERAARWAYDQAVRSYVRELDAQAEWPLRGRQVRVTGGKRLVGQVGEVLTLESNGTEKLRAHGIAAFFPGQSRVYVQTKAGKFWFKATEVAVVDPDQYRQVDPDQQYHQAIQAARRYCPTFEHETGTKLAARRHRELLEARIAEDRKNGEFVKHSYYGVTEEVPESLSHEATLFYARLHRSGQITGLDWEENQKWFVTFYQAWGYFNCVDLSQPWPLEREHYAAV